MNRNGAHPAGPSTGRASESPAYPGSPGFRPPASNRKDVKPTLASPATTRASVACAACRKQKMKCDLGAAGESCRRCTAQNLECLFESPAGGLGGRRNEFAERLNDVEGRLGDLENSKGNVAARIDQDRFGQLESQVKALQQHLSRIPQQFPAAAPPRHPTQAAPPPSAPLASPVHFYTPHPPLPRSHSIPHLLHNPLPPQQHPSHAPQHVSYQQHHQFRAPSTVSQHTSPAESSTSYRKRGSENGQDETQAENTIKRMRGPSSSILTRGSAADFITRGEVERDVALMCFESYFLSCSTSNTRLSLDFSNTRERSPLLLATLIAIGARSLSNQCYEVALAEALRLAQKTFFASSILSPSSPLSIDPSFEPTTIDFKAMIILSLYQGQPSLVSWVADLCGRFKLETSLLHYSHSTIEQQRSAVGQRQVRDGRTFLVAWFFAGLYSFVSGQGGSFFSIPAEVIRFQLDTLERSPCSIQPTDRIIRIHVEETLIIHSVYSKLELSQRIVPALHEEICDVLDSALSELFVWHRAFVDAMELVSTWGDEQALKTAIPLIHGRLTILKYLFRGPMMSMEAARSERVKVFAALGVESAIGMLRFGVESRVWCEQSSAAQYLHYVNIPLAVSTLHICTRLFPADANFPLIRSLLHQLSCQLDRSISANSTTAREIERARKTKMEVLEFDRFAFEHSGVENPVQDRETIFGEEITSSLSALAQDFSLWGVILTNALDD